MAYHARKNIVTDGLIFSIDANNNLCENTGSPSFNVVNLPFPTENGSSVNTVTVSEGKYFFDGTDSYIDFGNGGVAQKLRGATKFTVDLWVRIDPLAPTQGKDVKIGAFEYIPVNSGWYNQWGNGILYCGVSTAAYNNFTIPILEKYQNIVTVWDLTKPVSDKVTVYSDSVNILPSSFNLNATSVPTNIVDFRINKITNFSGGALLGSIPSLKIYDKTLTAEEVLQNYEALKHRFH